MTIGLGKKVTELLPARRRKNYKTGAAFKPGTSRFANADKEPKSPTLYNRSLITGNQGSTAVEPGEGAELDEALVLHSA